MANLQELQDLYFRAITRWEDEETAAGRLKPTEGPSNMARLEIYQRAYRSRLHKCVEADFPVTLSLLGSETFASLMELFFAKHNCPLPNINEFTGYWLNFFVGHSPDPSLTALAQFEFDMMLSFYRHIQTGHAQLHAEMILSENPRQTLVVDNSVLLRKSQFPVIEMQKQRRRLPEKQQFAVIWTNQDKISCVELTEHEFLLLELFATQPSLDDVLASLTFLPDPESAAAFLQQFVTSMTSRKILIGSESLN